MLGFLEKVLFNIFYFYLEECYCNLKCIIALLPLKTKNKILATVLVWYILPSASQLYCIWCLVQKYAWLHLTNRGTSSDHWWCRWDTYAFRCLVPAPPLLRRYLHCLLFWYFLKIFLDSKILFHFRYESECTERYGWMYMYYRRVDDPYRIPQWGFVAAPHHCACKITPKYIPDSWFDICALSHELKSSENCRDSPPNNCSRMISCGDMPIQMFTEDDGGRNKSGIFKCLIYWSCFMLSNRSRIKILLIRTK